jgi:hypothetical protein
LLLAAGALFSLTAFGQTLNIGGGVRTYRSLANTVVTMTGRCELRVTAASNFVGASAQFGLDTYCNTSAVLGAMHRNIGSFILKRGYMATFAQNSDGSGVSQAYVAQDDDLAVGVMATNCLAQIYQTTGKPLWVTEWNNGANWCSSGLPGSDVATQFSAPLNTGIVPCSTA